MSLLINKNRILVNKKTGGESIESPITYHEYDLDRWERPTDWVQMDLLPNYSILDNYTGASVAYSLRRVRTAYTGPAIKVRRSSDNQEMDIFFNSGGDLDTSTLLSFVGGGSGFVTRWYDQSGNNDYAYNDTASTQPRIVIGGVVTTSGNRPAIYWDNSRPDVLIINTKVWSGVNAIRSSFVNMKWVTGTGNTPIFGQTSDANFHPDTTGNNLILSEAYASNDIKYGALYLNGVSKTLNQFSKNINTNQVISIIQLSQIGYLNLLGNDRGYAAPDGYFKGYYSEIIIYPTDQSSNRTQIESNMNDYYSIYNDPLSEKEVVKILYGVYEQGPNFITIQASGTYSVDWGDGTTQSVSSGQSVRKEYFWGNLLDENITSDNFKQCVITIKPLIPGTLTSLSLYQKHNYRHDYSSVNVFEIKMRAPNLTSLTLQNPSISQYDKIRNFEFLGTHSITNMSSLLRYCYSLKHVKLDMSGVTNAYCMFNNCHRLTDVDIVNLESVTNMDNMFSSCYSLKELPDINANSCLNMQQMFSTCRSMVESPIIRNSSNVTTTFQMFINCDILNKVNLFDTSSVTNMISMFHRCYILKKIPLFNTQSVTDMNNMFSYCYKLRDVPKFNTSNVTDMNNMFRDCSELVNDSSKRGLPLFDTSKVTNMLEMFQSCGKLKTIPHFNTSSVTNMIRMFNGCSNLNNLPLIDTSSVTDMQEMFQYCYELETTPLFNTQNVTNMSYMFRYCYRLKQVPLYNTQNVTNMREMFACQQYSPGSLVYYPPFNTQNVTNMQEMFYSQQQLLNFTPLNMNKVTDIESMFQYCYKLYIVGDLYMPLVTDCKYVFWDCFNLRTIGNIYMPNVSTMEYMFTSCYRLVKIQSITTGTSLSNLLYTFHGCGRLKEVPLFNTVNVTNFQNTFRSTGLITIPLFNMASGTNFTQTFSACRNLKHIPNINTQSGTNFTDMFSDSYDLETVPVIRLDGFNQYLNSMFYQCRNLTAVTFSNINQSSYIRANRTFEGCYKLKSVSMPNAVIGTAYRMFTNCHRLETIGTFSLVSNDDDLGYQEMFSSCYKLNNIKDLVVLNKSQRFSWMFSSCHSLTETPYFDMSNAKSNDRQNNMFDGCYSLMKINATGSKYDLNISRCNLKYENLSYFLNGLSVSSVEPRYTIKMFENPGLAEMISIHKRKIVYDKGYTFSSHSGTGYEAYNWYDLRSYNQVNDTMSYSGNGSTLYDISGYSFTIDNPNNSLSNGTLINSPTYNGDNLQFNGVNQTITFGTQSTRLTEGTIFAVFELTDNPPINGTWSIMGRYGSTSSNYFLDFNNGRLRFGFTQVNFPSNGLNTLRHRTLSVTFSVGVRYFVAAAYDNTNRTRIWINGVLQPNSVNYSQNQSTDYYGWGMYMYDDPKNVLSVGGDYYNSRNYSKIKFYSMGVQGRSLDDRHIEEYYSFYKRQGVI